MELAVVYSDSVCRGPGSVVLGHQSLGTGAPSAEGVQL